MTTTDPHPEPPAVSYDISSDVVDTAVRHAIAATETEPVGDYGRAFLIPEGYTLTLVDERDQSDPDAPHHRSGTFRFVGVLSIAQYVNRYKTDDTLCYLNDLNGTGIESLTRDTKIARVVIDDHPVDATAFREHIAELVLRPTAAARRWGPALAGHHLGQDELLDLVVDGIREIAKPDGATLRDLVADLHAIRTTSARSVIRTGGQATVETADNVTLHGGTGNQVTIPETITVIFEPFAGVPASIVLDITVKPRIGQDEKVRFLLTAPKIDEQIADVLAVVHSDLEEHTAITPMWVP
jgi:uncharacterized protein YfdQ (DUF2303 family)